jgi:hypothetical protein
MSALLEVPAKSAVDSRWFVLLCLLTEIDFRNTTLLRARLAAGISTIATRGSHMVTTRIFLLAALLLIPAAHAQTTYATITGSVTDPNGLAIVNAEVTVRNTATGGVYGARTNEAGIYTVPQLLPGPYSLTARHDGFLEFVGKGIELRSQDIRTIDARLQIGAVATSVEVSGTAALIETETARVAESTTAHELNSLPVLQRRLQEFLPTIPTVTIQGGVMHFGGSAYNNQNYWSLDGTQIGSSGMVLNFVEGLAEVRINVGNATADQPGLANVSVVTKSGANELHGSAFDYYSSTNWSARNPFAAAGTGSITHNAGGSLGGPVYIPGAYNGRNRTFFYQTYERNLGGDPRAAQNATVPIAAWRGGNFAGQAAIKDPLTGQPFPGNIIPAARLNPASLKIQETFYPAPNYGDPNVVSAQNLRNVLVRPFAPVYMPTTRIDHRLSDKHYLYGRFSYSYSGGVNQDGSLPTIGLWYRPLTEWNWSVTETTNIRPSLVNEFRYGALKENGPQWGTRSGLDSVKSLGLVGLAPNLPDLPGLFSVSFTGLTMTGISQTVYHDPFSRNLQQQFHDNISWFHGRHTLKAGAMYGYNTAQDRAASANLYGSASFSNRFTNHSYADFLLGYPTTVARSFPREVANRIRTSTDIFVVDNWKVSPKLTLDLGIRYEYHPYSHERNGFLSMFDPASGKLVVPDAALGRVSGFFPAGYAGVVAASSVGLDPVSILHNDTNNVAPRVGFAWRPAGNATVLRGGFGVYYDVGQPQVAAAGVPFLIDEPAYTNPVADPIVLPRVYPATSLGGPATISLPKALRGDLRIPYSFQYTFSIDHEHWGTGFHLSYIGTGLRESYFDINVNQPLPDNRSFISKPRPFPNYPAIRETLNGAGNQHNGMVAKVDRRFAHGLSFEYSFTWSRDIGDLGSVYLGDLPRQLEDSTNRLRDRSSMYDVPIRRHTANFVYELPVGRKRRFLANAPRAVDAIVGGWRLASVLTTHSGQLLTPLWTGPDPTGTAFTASATPATVTIRPDRIADGNLSDDTRSISRWFDVSAFKAPQAGRFGTSGAGIILGPASFVLRGAVSKSFTVRDRLKWEMALQCSNILNHPNYSPPGLDITQSGSAGVINGIGNSTDTDQSGRRSVRVMLRMEF